ncbi:MAG: response regulator transcription factor, partial [Chloroflexota bacterium]|nr:response regulator transcription factor [Chloroflexota bacterium]
GVLCALRHTLPFDAVEVVAAEAAARLLSMAFADAQAALGGRYGAPEVTVGGHEATTTTEVAVSRATTEDVTPPLRVAVVESQPATRIGLEAIVERAGLTVAVSCATVAEAITRLAETRCEVAIVGTLAGGSASDAVTRLREHSPVPILVITDVRAGAHAALRAGASGHLAREAAPSSIVAALQAAASGLAAVDMSVLRGLLQTPADQAIAGETTDDDESPADPSAEPARAAIVERERGPARTADTLSPRELELLRYLAEGYTNKEIARVMVLADDTVKKGVQSLIAKLGATDRTHAVVLALRSGLIR